MQKHYPPRRGVGFFLHWACSQVWLNWSNGFINCWWVPAACCFPQYLFRIFLSPRLYVGLFFRGSVSLGVGAHFNLNVNHWQAVERVDLADFLPALFAFSV